MPNISLNNKSAVKYFFVCITFLFIAPKIFAGNNPDTNSPNSTSVTSGFNYQPSSNMVVDERSVKAGLLYDIQNKKIVWQKEMNTAYPIASLTKMMVALLAVEDVKSKKFAWGDTVRWTREIIVWKNHRKKIGYADAKYSLYDLFKAAMIASNNEAADRIARYLSGGDLDATIQRMNIRASDLGMNSTYYGNPTGLPSSRKIYDNSASPVDLLLLTMEMLKYDEILKVTGMDYADVSNGKHTTIIQNHNKLTIDYSGQIDGMKTGYTKHAGFCLVATTNKCNSRLVSIVLGCRGPAIRNEIVKNMFNDYYSSIGLDKLTPGCINPNLAENSVGSSNDEEAAETDGEYEYQTRIVNKIYAVKRGEHLADIAVKYGCSLKDMKSWNHLRYGRVVAGQRLLVKVVEKEKVWVTKSADASQQKQEVKTNATAEATKPKDTSPKIIYHIVHPGDTLFNIAKRYSVNDIEVLKSVNGISDSKSLKVGMKIKVPVNG